MSQAAERLPSLPCKLHRFCVALACVCRAGSGSRHESSACVPARPLPACRCAALERQLAALAEEGQGRYEALAASLAAATGLRQGPDLLAGQQMLAPLLPTACAAGFADLSAHVSMTPVSYWHLAPCLLRRREDAASDRGRIAALEGEVAAIKTGLSALADAMHDQPAARNALLAAAAAGGAATFAPGRQGVQVGGGSAAAPPPARSPAAPGCPQQRMAAAGSPASQGPPPSGGPHRNGPAVSVGAAAGMQQPGPAAGRSGAATVRPPTAPQAALAASARDPQPPASATAAQACPSTVGSGPPGFPVLALPAGVAVFPAPQGIWQQQHPLQPVMGAAVFPGLGQPPLQPSPLHTQQQLAAAAAMAGIAQGAGAAGGQPGQQQPAQQNQSGQQQQQPFVAPLHLLPDPRFAQILMHHRQHPGSSASSGSTGRSLHAGQPNGAGMPTPPSGTGACPAVAGRGAAGAAGAPVGIAVAAHRLSRPAAPQGAPAGTSARK